MAGRGGTALPGLVDLQVNGAFGHDFTTDPTSVWEVARRLPEHGVTAFLPTVISCPVEQVIAALGVLAAGPPDGWRGARPLGLHVEGPMLAPSRRGTHPERHLQSPSRDLVEALVDAGPPAMVTIAPELPGAEEAIRRLVAAGTVVALGHSDCDAATARAAVGWGARHVTHLFNGMSGLDHRRPGLAAVALADERLTVGLVADGVHVHPDMLALANRLAGPRLVLVTDATAGLGAGDGRHVVGDVPVQRDGITVRNETGELAGSAAPMHHVVATMQAAVGEDAPGRDDGRGRATRFVRDVVAMASTTPLGVLGLAPEPGDQVLVDEHGHVVATAVAGKVVFDREAAGP